MDTEITPLLPVELPAEPSPDVKPGWKTSEFWKSAIAMIVSLIFASGAVTEGSGFGQVLGMIAMVLGSMGYSVSRGLAKAKAVTP